MLLAARLTWCMTGTADGTEVQAERRVIVGGGESLGAAAAEGGEDGLENVMSAAS